MTTIAARMRNGSLVSEERNSAAAPVNEVATVSGRPICCFAFSIAGIASLERAAGAEIEGDGRGRKLALVRNGERRVALVHGGERAQRHRLTGARLHVNLVEHSGRRAEVRFHFENDAELIELRENDRDLALAKRVVERVVDRLREDVEARRFLAIDIDIELQAVDLLIARHVGELRKLPESLHQLRRPLGQLGRVRILQNVLVLRAADAANRSANPAPPA